jgi:carbamoyltransferase
MKVLGLHASGPNTASCLLIDGELIAFAEEERFTRVKLATNAVPTRSAGYCLREAGLDLSDIDFITLGWANSKYPAEMQRFYSERMSHPDKDEYSKVYELISLNEKAPPIFGKRLQIAFRRAGYHGSIPPIRFHPHHLSHAYSVYYPSPFDEALILIIDGSGEEMATSLWIGRSDVISFDQSFELPDSLGYFYAALTEYLGFSVFTGEGKVMGLAPYGKPNLELRNKLDNLLWIDGDGYRVAPEYIYFAPRTFSLRHTDKLVDLLGAPPRRPESELTDWHHELAWEVQHKLESVVEHIVRAAVRRTGIRNICIAGGVAMNCKMNGFISTLDCIDGCYVIPASNDAGAAYGSALIQSIGVSGLRDKARRISVYSGPEFDDVEIESLLQEYKIWSYQKLGDDELFGYVADRLANGAIIGWFQSRMEVGARALGNRSILANPAFPAMKDKINREVKHRERFRPFAPAILEEHAHQYFSVKHPAHFNKFHRWMLQAATILPSAAERIPAVVHVDQSIRPQIVNAQSNPRFFELLKAFHARTDVPVLLNTSFNVRGEPIVCRPEEAIRCFFSTGLDVLVMQNIVLEK